jgi:hypothetical protein
VVTRGVVDVAMIDMMTDAEMIAMMIDVAMTAMMTDAEMIDMTGYMIN